MKNESGTNLLPLLVLPAPPIDEQGWPWKVADWKDDMQPEKGCPWPRISIVTPSYNQGEFLEEAIRSVLLQGYPNLEYIVLDGGSKDDSVQIIQKYAPYLSYWRSQEDRGQSAAIQEGFAISTGEILGWLNSDDLLLPGALCKVAAYFCEHPEVDCVVGGAVNVDASGNIVQDRLGFPKVSLGRRETLHTLLARVGCSFYQPASFWRRQAYVSVGGLDPSLFFAMDFDLYLKLAQEKPLEHIKSLLACFRRHSQSKSTTASAIREQESKSLVEKYGEDVRLPLYYRFLLKSYLALTDRWQNLALRMGVASGVLKLPYGRW